MCMACAASGLGALRLRDSAGAPDPAQSVEWRRDDDRPVWTAGDGLAAEVMLRQLSRFARALIESLAGVAGLRARTEELDCGLGLPGTLTVREVAGEIARYSAVGRRRPAVGWVPDGDDGSYLLDPQFALLCGTARSKARAKGAGRNLTGMVAP